jgi:Family of unknown function (DUF6459)
MSAPLTPTRREVATRVSLRALAEYEPARMPVPTDPDEVGGPAKPRPSRTAPARRRPAGPDYPVWNEPSETIDWLRGLLRIVLEVLDGRRQPGQLRGALDEASRAALLAQSQDSARSGRQHRLHTLHTCQPVPEAIELCATIVVSSTSRRRQTLVAMVGRVERTSDGSWRCRALRLL